MERLTDKRLTGKGFVCVDRKEYKNIMFKNSPSLKQIYHRLLVIENILGDDYDLDHLRELVDADRAGRCVVFPCNVGDILKKDGFDYKADHWNIILSAFTDDINTRSGKRVCLFSVQEAEEALRGMKDD